MQDKWYLELFDWHQFVDDDGPLLIYGNAPVAVKGELTYIAGHKKTLKTHIAYAMALAAMGASKEACVGFELAKGNVPQKVMVVDTEQPQKQHAAVINAMESVAPDVNLQDMFLPLRWKGRKTSKDMQEALPLVIEHYRPGLLILDGIADFVSDINSYEESRFMVTLLQHLAEKYDCAIIALIHFNPGTDKERGHLGTIIANKADWCIRAKRENGYVKVSPDGGSRGKPFSEYNVEYNEQSQWIIKVDTNHAKDITTMIPSLFRETGKNEMDRKEIVKLAQEKWGIHKSSSTTVDRALKEAMAKGLVVQNTPRGPYSLPKSGNKIKQ